jgi:thioredoxin reductase (NADPH)
VIATFEGLSDSQTFSVPSGAYGKMSPDQLASAARYGIQRCYTSSTRLYRQGERAADFYIVLEGTVQTFWSDAISGEEHFITLEAGEFSGELNLLNQRETLIAARALEGSSVLRIPRDRLREFLVAEPDIGELVVRTIVHRRQWFVQIGVGGLALLADGDSGESEKLARFLTANSYPFRVVDTRRSSEAQAVFQERGLQDVDLPAVISGKWMLKQPPLRALANKLGISEDVREGITWDVLVVGAGPAGLATAVYAASEGLRTLALDNYAAGGQAGTKFENRELPRILQWHLRRRTCKTGPGASSKGCGDRHGREVSKIERCGIGTLRRSGVHYSATPIDVQPCLGLPVVMVGGGNSAGQAAMYLSTRASHVHMLIRRPQLSSTMSDYLVQLIRASKSITLHPCSEVVSLEGTNHLSHVA